MLSLVSGFCSHFRGESANTLEPREGSLTERGRGRPLLNMMSHIVIFFFHPFLLIQPSTITGGRFPLLKKCSSAIKSMQGDITIMKHFQISSPFF